LLTPTEPGKVNVQLILKGSTIMNERQNNLLRILLANPDKFYQIEALRKPLHCSEKTVRNDLDILENFLKPYTNAHLVRKPGTGISLQITENAQAEIFQRMYRMTTKTNEERLIEIAYHLLSSSNPVTLKKLAEEYFTNPADIKKDLEKIATWLSQFHVTITTRQRIGSIVEGEEFDKRKALAHLSELVSSHDRRNYVLDFFPEVEVNAVKKAIRDTQRQFNLEFTDGRLEGLIIHALIMIKRTRQRTPVIVSDEEREKTLRKQEYKITTSLLNKLEGSIRLKIPRNERIYYAWHISGAIQNPDTSDQSIENSQSHQLPKQTVSQIIKKVQHLTNLKFENDSVLLDGLSIHIDAALKRISYGFHITNPMLHDIKKLYPYLFSMIVFALNEINKQQNITIPEEEAAYLVLHFQASIERMEQKTPKKALIVCHLGMGMSLLLQAKIEQQYKGLTVIDCIAQNELNTFLQHNVSIDLIISTVPLTIPEIPHVTISPLLNEGDKMKLNHFIQEDQQASKAIEYPTLHHFISNGLFQKDIDLDHPYKVVERLANQLVRLAVVDESFIQSIMHREKTSYTSIGGKIAIPHAQPSTVKKSTLSMAILKKPIQWGLEKVSIIFVLAINEEDRQMTRDLLKEISHLSEDPCLIEKIMNAHGKKDVEHILR